MMEQHGNVECVVTSLQVFVRPWVIGEGGVVTVPLGNWIEAVVEPVFLDVLDEGCGSRILYQ